jgi:hypothetical protein
VRLDEHVVGAAAEASDSEADIRDGLATWISAMPSEISTRPQYRL